MKDISLVIPVFNEEESLKPLVEAIYKVVPKLTQNWECLFIDDGSKDQSFKVLNDLKQNHPEIRIVRFKRNFGQTAAMSAGFDYAEGEIIVAMDADLQNDPEDIPEMIKKLNEGYDLVNGWRKSRQDSFLRVLPSIVANALISRVTNLDLHDYGCTLKVYRREVAKSLKLYGEMHRFIPALASWSGVSITEMPVKHHARRLGQSKYGISRTFRVMLDLFTVKYLLSYSTSPIQIFGMFGFLTALIGLAFFAMAIALKITLGRTLTGNPLFYLFIFLETMCIQVIFIGLLGEMNIRMHHELSDKKIYVVDRVS